MERFSITIDPTSSGGAGTGTFQPTQDGELLVVNYIKDDYVNNVTLSIASAQDTAHIIFATTLGNMDVSTTYYPATDGHVLLTGAADDAVHVRVPVRAGELYALTIAAGGDSKGGTFNIIIG